MFDSMAYDELSSISAVPNRDSVVRIVLASRMVEVYDGAVSASLVMQKYPGLCLARPEVFQRPQESLIGPNETLRPGQKFYLVPETTVKKLQQKYRRETSCTTDEAGVKAVALDTVEGERVRSARDFYASKERWTEYFMMKFMRGPDKPEEEKPFSPPIKRTKTWIGVLDGWKPALPAVEEISP